MEAEESWIEDSKIMMHNRIFSKKKSVISERVMFAKSPCGNYCSIGNGSQNDSKDIEYRKFDPNFKHEFNDHLIIFLSPWILETFSKFALKPTSQCKNGQETKNQKTLLITQNRNEFKSINLKKYESMHNKGIRHRREEIE
jgi:hypothetical protein